MFDTSFDNAIPICLGCWNQQKGSRVLLVEAPTADPDEAAKRQERIAKLT